MFEARFLAKVLRPGPLPPGRPELGPCWLWTGAKVANRGGEYYGRVNRDGKNVGVHRVAFEMWVGPIPEGHQVHHRCHVTLCVRPDHLEAKTPRENLMADDTPARRNASKTHCKRDHEFTPANTRVRPDGTRVCRECLRMLNRKYKTELRRRVTRG